MSAAEAEPEPRPSAEAKGQRCGWQKRRPQERSPRRRHASQAARQRADQKVGAPASRERYRRAKELLAHVDRNQRRLGERWSERDLQRFEAEDRELLRSSRDPADHAHRAGYERAQFEALQGPERERAEQEIEKATQARLPAPGGCLRACPAGSSVAGAQAAERVRQGAEELGGATARREQLRRAAPRAPQPRSPGAAAQPEPGMARWPPRASALALGSLLRRLRGPGWPAAIGFAGQSPPRRSPPPRRQRRPAAAQRRDRAERQPAGLRGRLSGAARGFLAAFFRYEVGELGAGGAARAARQRHRRLRRRAAQRPASPPAGSPPRGAAGPARDRRRLGRSRRGR